jgi:hypothetical protein
MSSTDPFANTTTVKNILQHVLSPKIVNDGSGGFKTATDLVNIDAVNANRLILSLGTGDGSSGNPFTGQCGKSTIGAQLGNTQIYIQGVTRQSVVFGISEDNNYPVAAVYPDNDGSVLILLASGASAGYNISVSWFVARF